MDYIDNALLYHIGRKDHRHNFSIYFMPIYLSIGSETSGIYQIPYFSVLTFAPQAFLILIFSLYTPRKKSMALFQLTWTWFIITMVFVSWNKVVTSQYFLWYLCFLPLIVLQILNYKDMNHGKKKALISFSKATIMLLSWVFGQALWLSQAYRLEMLGQNTYYEIWISSILFFIANCWIIVQFVGIMRRILPKASLASLITKLE